MGGGMGGMSGGMGGMMGGAGGGGGMNGNGGAPVSNPPATGQLLADGPARGPDPQDH